MIIHPPWAHTLKPTVIHLHTHKYTKEYHFLGTWSNAGQQNRLSWSWLWFTATINTINLTCTFTTCKYAHTYTQKHRWNIHLVWRQSRTQNQYSRQNSCDVVQCTPIPPTLLNSAAKQMCGLEIFYFLQHKNNLHLCKDKKEDFIWNYRKPEVCQTLSFYLYAKNKSQ